MTPAEFDALLDTLPNGLHDAELVSLTLDLAVAEVQCIVDVDLSDPDDPAAEGRSRPARLVFAGVSFLVIDPPQCDLTTLPLAWIDAGSGDPWTLPRPDLQAPDDGFLAWIFLHETNSFIRVGARQASLAWLGEARQAP
jgi:hypothetical protein